MNGEIWVLAEVRDGEPTRVAFQMLGAARRLAAARDLDTVALLIGGEPPHAGALASISPRVVHLEGPGLAPYESSRHLAAVWQLFGTRGTPHAILASAGTAGMEILPRLAARIRAGYAASCVDLRWEGEHLAARRPVLGGRAYEEVVFESPPAAVTVRAGSFDAAAALENPGVVETMTVETPDRPRTEILDRRRESGGRRALAEAARVVAGGRGMGEAGNFRLLEELAEALDASVAASRSVVDAGWRPHDEQVGKSGKTISPELYIACGIHGAVHHVLGMNTSKTVVAINTDPEAPIFRNADFGLVGDALELVPALTRELKKP